MSTEISKLKGKAAFNPPIAEEDDFELRVLRKKVKLEMIIIDTYTVTGYVRVANLSYAKTVAVRYTMDKRNYLDVEAEWIESVANGKMDRFIFTLPAPKESGELSFAIRYNNNYCDDNNKRHYTVLFESQN